MVGCCYQGLIFPPVFGAFHYILCTLPYLTGVDALAFTERVGLSAKRRALGTIVLECNTTAMRPGLSERKTGKHHT